jgi:hypothetical protein
MSGVRSNTITLLHYISTADKSSGHRLYFDRPKSRVHLFEIEYLIQHCVIKFVITFTSIGLNLVLSHNGYMYVWPTVCVVIVGSIFFYCMRNRSYRFEYLKKSARDLSL